MKFGKSRERMQSLFVISVTGFNGPDSGKYEEDVDVTHRRFMGRFS
jgi:hypothetical protein